MKLIDNRKTNDPYLNFAIEEFAVRKLDCDEDFLLLYINKPTVVLGKHQVALAEMNYHFVRENDICIARRISGGGTVFHDRGNINFCHITKFETSKINNYKTFTKPILDAVKKLGLKAKLNERNGIILNGKKISGNAQFTNRKNMLSHGTLLFSCDLEKINSSLLSSFQIETKASKSVRNEVANVSDFFKENLEIEEFLELLKAEYFQKEMRMETYHFSKNEWQQIISLRNNKYASWSWIYGKSPAFSILKRVNNSDVKFYVKNGFIGKVETQNSQNQKWEICIENEFLGRKFDEWERENYMVEFKAIDK